MPFETTPMILADLKDLAKTLPDIGLDMNHEKEILKRYTDHGWPAVNRYVDFVELYYKDNFATPQNKPLGDSISDWWGRILENTKEFVTVAKRRVL